MHQQHRIIEYLKSINIETNDIYHVDAEKYFKKQSTLSEVVLISRMLDKINRRKSEQLRSLVISSEFLYNIDKKSIKRKVAITKIHSVTVSKKSQELVIHVPSENDLLYKSQDHRDAIVFYLAIAFKLHNIEGIKIYFVEDEDLQQYCMHQQVADPQKQLALHPRCLPQILLPESFQLNYINIMNKIKQSRLNDVVVLFANDPLRLRVKIEEYQKSVILAQGSLCKIYLLHNKQEKQQQFSVLKSLDAKQVDIDLLELFLKNYQNFPFIEELELCLLYNGYVHFIFKFIKGGDLYQHLKEVNNFSEQQVKQLVAQIAMGLSDLHERGIIFGDLKPENILIDERGYVYLTDFGYGKLRVYQDFKRSQAICFTPEYASPEYIKHGDLTRMSDWYSLGILMYELLVGITPFYHTNFEIALKLINRGELHFPRNLNCSHHCKDLIQKLINHDSIHRIGFQSDFKEIQAHPWFNDIHWGDLHQKKYDTLSYIPQLNEASQISERYFTMQQLSEDERNW